MFVYVGRLYDACKLKLVKFVKRFVVDIETFVPGLEGENYKMRPMDVSYSILTTINHVMFSHNAHD